MIEPDDEEGSGEISRQADAQLPFSLQGVLIPDPQGFPEATVRIVKVRRLQLEHEFVVGLGRQWHDQGQIGSFRTFPSSGDATCLREEMPVDVESIRRAHGCDAKREITRAGR